MTCEFIRNRDGIFEETYARHDIHNVSELLALSASAPHAFILLLSCISIFLARIYFHSFIFHVSSFMRGAIVSSRMDSDGHSIGGATVGRYILFCSSLKCFYYSYLLYRCGNMSNEKLF